MIAAIASFKSIYRAMIKDSKIAYYIAMENGGMSSLNLVCLMLRREDHVLFHRIRLEVHPVDKEVVAHLPGLLTGSLRHEVASTLQIAGA